LREYTPFSLTPKPSTQTAWAIISVASLISFALLGLPSSFLGLTVAFTRVPLEAIKLILLKKGLSAMEEEEGTDVGGLLLGSGVVRFVCRQS
jgi:hypothetical protein